MAERTAEQAFEALLSAESIERAARVLYLRDARRSSQQIGYRPPGWDQLDEQYRTAYLQAAESMLRASVSAVR